MATSYTVVKGDTLTKIAARYDTTVANLVEWNNIANPDYIVIGQVLKVSKDATSGGVSSESRQSRAVVSVFGLQANTDRSVYAVWNWDQDNTLKYKMHWHYQTDQDDTWFEGENSSTTNKHFVYSAPSNATKVKFKVKPMAKTRKVNGVETEYWMAGWSTVQVYDFDDNPPEAPSAPSVTIDKFKLTAELDNLDESINRVQFQVVKDNAKVFKQGTANVSTRHVSFSCTVDAGGEYKVRCRAYKAQDTSDWSEYSENVSTIPAASSGITTCQAKSETSVYLAWKSVNTAETYEIEYATKKDYFDNSDAVTSKGDIKQNHFEITGLESGQEYFFRVRAVNAQGESAWTEIVSIAIGKDPAPPTTWSSTTTAIISEPLNLYWVHNSEDNSSQVKAELELTINGETQVYTIVNTTNEEEKDKTSLYSVDTSKFSEGAKITWRVRTCGITGVYGDWSIERTIDVYAPPTLELLATDLKGEMIEILTEFPIRISAISGPNTQSPIGYYLTIITNEAYDTVDYLGNDQHISKGEQVYSKYFNSIGNLSTDISAGDVNLDNNIHYTIECVVAMSSGLTAVATQDFIVEWDESGRYEPTAEVGVDSETLAAYIRPYCLNPNVLLSVYRREFDGAFTEIATGIENERNTFVTDPHPSLDFARYRIVATDKSTGAVTFNDIPGYPVGEPSIVIQWDEEWTEFDTTTEEVIEEKPWAGSMLKLPYNVDVSDKNSPDVSLIKYTGRSHPVTYYGTQLGTSSSWKTDVVKSDKDTIYALRRLQRWMGDVYVREPSGVGYWAHITVSFSLTHRNLVVPVTIDVTRVEGGM